MACVVSVSTVGGVDVFAVTASVTVVVSIGRAIAYITTHIDVSVCVEGGGGVDGDTVGGVVVGGVTGGVADVWCVVGVVVGGVAHWCCANMWWWCE